MIDAFSPFSINPRLTLGEESWRKFPRELMTPVSAKAAVVVGRLHTSLLNSRSRY